MIVVVTITLVPVSFPSNDTVVIESLLGHPVGVVDDNSGGHNGDCVSSGPSTTTVSSASEHDKVVSVSSVSLLSSSRSGMCVLFVFRVGLWEDQRSVKRSRFDWIILRMEVVA